MQLVGKFVDLVVVDVYVTLRRAKVARAAGLGAAKECLFPLAAGREFPKIDYEFHGLVVDIAEYGESRRVRHNESEYRANKKRSQEEFANSFSVRQNAWIMIAVIKLLFLTVGEGYAA